MLRLPRLLNTSTLRCFATTTRINIKSAKLSTFIKPKLTNPVKSAFERKPLPVSKILSLAIISSSTTPLLFEKPVQCQASTVQINKAVEDIIQEPIEIKRQPLLRKGELSFGTFLGLCTGYLVKKVGKIFIGFVGATFVFLQYMAWKGFITVHWDRIEGSYTHTLDSDRNGRVTTRDLHTKWNAFIGLLTHNIQFKSTFLVGFYAGIRYG